MSQRPLPKDTPISTVSIDDQIKEVARELEMRKRVFPRLIVRKKMTFVEAKEHMDAMGAVLRTLENVKEGKPWDA